MKIIIHRVNKIKELKKIPAKYGVEIDIRSYGKKLVLNHEPANNGDELKNYLKNFNNSILIANIKEAGIENKVLKLKMDLSQGSGMVIWLGTLFLAGFTPLPYKVFTITSGLIAFDIIAFIIISFISRGLRFYLVSILTAKFGEKFVKLIEQKGAVWSSIIGIIIVCILAIIDFAFIK